MVLMKVPSHEITFFSIQGKTFLIEISNTSSRIVMAIALAAPVIIALELRSAW